MAEVMVQLPEDLGIVMRRHVSINWSDIAADAIRKAASELEMLDAMALESKLTEEDALIMGKKIKKGMWEKVYEKMV